MAFPLIPAAVGLAARLVGGAAVRLGAGAAARGAAARGAGALATRVGATASTGGAAAASSTAMTVGRQLIGGMTVGAAAGGAMSALKSAVGYAIKKEDFRVLLASTGLEYAQNRWISSVSRESARVVADTADLGTDPAKLEREMGLMGIQVLYRRPAPGDRARLIKHWDTYGYAVKDYVQSSRLDVMSAYSYWRASEVTVRGAMPASAKDLTKAIFEKGTTIWTNVSQIGTTPTNTPRSGISY